MSSGGSRFGAGRPGYRLKAEWTQRIDIRHWRRCGNLQAGKSFTWAWTYGGEPSGSVVVVVGVDTVRLTYALKNNADEWRDASQTIRTTATPCHFGGWRRWFECPQCRDRAAVLYLRGGRFACRHCNRISYVSQSGSTTARLCNRYHKLAALIDEGKPKWQRWATFNKLEVRFERVSQQFNSSLVDCLAALGFKGFT